jgi:CBS-domain-containing membrane protein
MASRQAETFMEVMTQCLRGGACLAAPIRAKYANDIMASPAIIVNEQIPVLEVAKMITIKKINGVRIVDQDARMKSIISQADVVESSLLQVGYDLIGLGYEREPEAGIPRRNPANFLYGYRSYR